MRRYSYNGSDINCVFHLHVLIPLQEPDESEVLFFFFSLEPYFIGDPCKLWPLKAEKLQAIHQCF